MVEGGPPRLVSLRLLAILSGPVMGAVAYLCLPAEYLGHSGQAIAVTDQVRCTIGVLVWMSLWWLTHCVPLALTAVLPVLLFPIWGVLGYGGTLKSYYDPMIRLFFGGFLLSEAIARWGLGERLSLKILSMVGTRPAQVVAGLMFVTAIISAFVSNSATAAMMLPIALSVTQLMRAQMKSESAKNQENFATCTMLGVGYAASLGGLMTIIGTPPNVFLVGYLGKTIDEASRLDISFFQWMGVGVPLACILLPICWWLLTKWYFPLGKSELTGAREMVRDRYAALGRMKAGEWATVVAFGMAVVLWVSNSFVSTWTFEWNGSIVQPFSWLSDWVVAMMAAGLLFVWPVSLSPPRTALTPLALFRIPWSVLILFGGGLALSSAMSASHTDKFLAAHVTLISTWPIWLVVAVSVTLVVFFSEIASNLAAATTLVPIFGAISLAWGVHPVYMAVAVTLAASCGFMLPVATPPNAIVFSSGLIRQRDMLRAGWALNWICILVISLLSWTLVDWFLN